MGSLSGAALVSKIKTLTYECINGFYTATGDPAKNAFGEAKMITVANAVRDASATYSGDGDGGLLQLIHYLQAGFYAQWGHEDVVGSYGSSLRAAVRDALDAFFAAPHSHDVSDANGRVLQDAVPLIFESSDVPHFIPVIKRLLNDVNDSWLSQSTMTAAVNNVFALLFRAQDNGGSRPGWLSALEADPSLIDTLHSFAVQHWNLASGDLAHLVTAAVTEVTRFLQDTALKSTVRPLAKDLVQRSTGTATGLGRWWVAVALNVKSYDQANCSYYDTCDVSQTHLRDVVMQDPYQCSPSIRIVAQQMTIAQLQTVCTSLTGQDAYFHNVVKDTGPVANDKNTTIEVVIFKSDAYDYKPLASLLYGDVSTANGGIYEEGDPASAENQARFFGFWNGSEVWNLNHEYTHYLDGRFDKYGPDHQDDSTIWWSEGLAEYVAYSYLNKANTAATSLAGNHTWKLSQLFDTTYGDTDKVYKWGYLAVRYMLESHRADVDALLGYWRAGDYTGASTYLHNTVGTKYDSDWNTWLNALPPAPPADGGGPPVQCSGQDLGNNCTLSNLAKSGPDPLYFRIYIPAGTPQLTITTSGGTGDADLYYNKDGWATKTSYTSKATDPGNSHTLTITNPPAGTNYISLYANTAFSGVTLTTQYGTTTQPPANQAPTAGFSSTVSGLTASFTDTSTDADGTIASRSW
ncbi:M9 family metallopeptidase, partial [Streptomyces sp. NPDC020800]|uniref:M9 family metallopeptidase n=1 Tax=Streptomyces sp. NPDC020800 TaxID=3365092 RepID=UPI0037A7373B